MRFLVTGERLGMASMAADWIVEHAAPLTDGRREVLALAVGASVVEPYRLLGRRPGCLAGATAVTIDELHRMDEGDPRLFGSQLKALVQPGSGLSITTFDSTAAHPDNEALRVDEWVRSRGIAACVLGLGPNGHLALNEPGEAFLAPSRFVPFESGTLEHLGGAAAIMPATGGMTLSLSTLMSATSVLLVVDGAKRAALESLIWGPLSVDMPMSVLRLHPDVTVMVHKDVLGGVLEAVRQLPGVCFSDDSPVPTADPTRGCVSARLATGRPGT